MSVPLNLLGNRSNGGSSINTVTKPSVSSKGSTLLLHGLRLALPQSEAVHQCSPGQRRLWRRRGPSLVRAKVERLATYGDRTSSKIVMIYCLNTIPGVFSSQATYNAINQQPCFTLPTVNYGFDSSTPCSLHELFLCSTHTTPSRLIYLAPRRYYFQH